MIYALNRHSPKIIDWQNCWIAPNAQIIGKVTIHPYASIWFGAVIRGDNEPISIGVGSNVQENSVLHTDMGFPINIGKNCTIGHKAMLHGCVIKDNCLIGMDATILNGALIGNNCLIAAKALITQNKKIPDHCLVIGSPARVVRKLTTQEMNQITQSARDYQKNARYFKNHLATLN